MTGVQTLSLPLVAIFPDFPWEDDLCSSEFSWGTSGFSIQYAQNQARWRAGAQHMRAGWPGQDVHLVQCPDPACPCTCLLLCVQGLGWACAYVQVLCLNTQSGIELKVIYFFFFPTPTACRSSRPRMEPTPQQQPKSQQWQFWVLNLLSHQGTLWPAFFTQLTMNVSSCK